MLVARLFMVVYLLCVSLQAFAAPPNVVIVLTDDQGWGDLSIHGNTNLSTPNIDTLAQEGALFSRFYVSPLCAPTRAELLTGRYHFRTGVRGVTRGRGRLNLDESTVFDMFKQAGYSTGMFGKWHNGTQDMYHPNERGLDEFYGFTSGHWGHYFDAPMEHNGEFVTGKGYMTDDLTDRALSFIEENKKSPFVCYLAYNTPHSPFQVPDKFYAKFDGVDVAMRHRDPKKESMLTTRAVLGMIENIDWNVGRVMKKLEDLGLEDDTIFIYFSDNGPNSYRWNGGLKGKKSDSDEGGVRVPFMIKWPGHITPKAQVDRVAGVIDILPTLASLAGVNPVGTKALDGLDLTPLLSNASADWADRQYLTRWRGMASVRNQRFMMDTENNLFDIEKDPGQRNPVTAQHPEVAAAFKKVLDDIRTTVDYGLVEYSRPYSVGRSPKGFTQLPARDARESGGIQRARNAPNSSYFTHWTSKQDIIRWNVDVGKTGLYEAVLYYACPEKDLGSTIELAFGNEHVSEKITAKVTVAHDPPLLGEAEDRVPRGGESYMKKFKPMTLGRIKLTETIGIFTLRALDIPGDSVMEFGTLVLRQVEDE